MNEAAGFEGAEVVAAVAVGSDVLVAQAQYSELPGGFFALAVTVGGLDECLGFQSVEEELSGVIVGGHGVGAIRDEGVVGNRCPSGVLADVSFFEEAGAVVVGDTVEEELLFSPEVFLPEYRYLAAFTFEWILDDFSAEFAVGAVFRVGKDM